MATIRNLTVLLPLLPLLTCHAVDKADRPMAKGVLEISFELNPSESEDVEPSYQTVIWLEDEDGRYVKSLLVSEYLAYGGYTKPEICTEWSGRARWDEVTEAELDAVTSATPPVEANAFSFDCQREKLRTGAYRYCVQTHIIEAYNILYTGVIEIGGEVAENTAKGRHLPRRHPGAGDVLSGVKANYHP